jgi:hypothetical protein
VGLPVDAERLTPRQMTKLAGELWESCRVPAPTMAGSALDRSIEAAPQEESLQDHEERDRNGSRDEERREEDV